MHSYPRRRNVAAQVAEELKPVTYATPPNMEERRKKDSSSAVGFTSATASSQTKRTGSRTQSCLAYARVLRMFHPQVFERINNICAATDRRGTEVSPSENVSEWHRFESHHMGSFGPDRLLIIIMNSCTASYLQGALSALQIHYK